MSAHDTPEKKQAPEHADTLSRREFLKRGSAAGVAGALSAGIVSTANTEKKAVTKVPTAILGRTGMRVSRLAHGGSWDVDPEVLSVGFELGLNYIDTAEYYRGGRSEELCGGFLHTIGATGHNAARKKVWLVSKTFDHHNLEAHLPGSLERLRQDYVDVYFMHMLRDPKTLSDPTIKAAGERLVKSGKTRFFGFSCHDGTVVECLNAAADCGYVDVIMFRYDHHYYKQDDLNRAIDRCVKANIGLVAMKTQVGGMTLPDKFDPFKKRGLNQHQAALKAVAVDERMHSICSEMITVDMVRQNAEAVSSKLTTAEAEAIQEHARLVSHLWCRGCEHLCKAQSGAGAQLAVADTLRFLMYHDHYGKRSQARELFADLPEAQRDLEAIALADWTAAEQACPYRVPLAKLMPRAKERLA